MIYAASDHRSRGVRPPSAAEGARVAFRLRSAAGGSRPDSPPSPTRWTEVGLVLMVFIWGANFAVVKRALQAFEPLAFNALRFAVASAFVYAVLRFSGDLGRPERADVPRIVLLGVVGNVAYQLCFILGLDRTRAGNAAVILALTPVLITLLSAVRGHERPGRRAWLGVGISVVGVALVTGATPSLTRRELFGDLILVGATVVWAIYTVGLQPLIARYGSLRPTAWTLWIGTAGLLLLGTPELLRQRWSVVDGVAWGGLFFSALLAIGLAYLLWYRGVERIGNTRTAVFSNLVSVVALLVAAVWLGERPAPLQFAGVALVLGGVMLVRSGRSPRPVAAARA